MAAYNKWRNNDNIKGKHSKDGANTQRPISRSLHFKNKETKCTLIFRIMKRQLKLLEHKDLRLGKLNNHKGAREKEGSVLPT